MPQQQLDEFVRDAEFGDRLEFRTGTHGVGKRELRKPRVRDVGMPCVGMPCVGMPCVGVRGVGVRGVGVWGVAMARRRRFGIHERAVSRGPGCSPRRQRGNRIEVQVILGVAAGSV